MTKTIRFLVAIALLLVCRAEVNAAVVTHVEATNGELSGNSNAPTALGMFMPGTNSVTGQVTSIGGGFSGTADVFSFQIGAGTQLDSVFLTSFSSSSNSIFMALDDALIFPYTAEEINDNVDFPDLSVILSGRTVGSGVASAGTDILDDLQAHAALGGGVNGAGFTIPLGPGNYSVYLQETAAFSDYSLAFNVSAVPEPSSAFALAMCALFGVARRRRR